jgi:hypothetical protein
MSRIVLSYINKALSQIYRSHAYTGERYKSRQRNEQYKGKKTMKEEKLETK